MGRIVVSMYLQAEWKILWILIRWLCEKPADLVLQSFQKKDKSGFSRTRVKNQPPHTCVVD